MRSLSKLFSFRKGDRDAIIILVVVIVACVVLIPLLRDKDGSSSTGNGKSSQFYGGSQHKYFAQPGKNDGSVPADRDSELFPFDPNTADSTQLLRLGLQPWQVRSIYKYRSKGGRFRKKEDFARLYGLTLEKYRQLEPYIRIKQEVMAADVITSTSSDHYGRNTSNGYSANTSQPSQKETGAQTYSAPATPRYTSNKIRPGETIDINTADTTLLKRIPGIGSYFARRIVELRQRKQAFVSPKELLSIRNFPEETLPFMTCSQNFPKIHINKLSLRDLEKHPLLNYVQARDIINLRKMTGNIHSAKELSTLPSFNQQLIEKVAPFLVFD